MSNEHALPTPEGMGELYLGVMVSEEYPYALEWRRAAVAVQMTSNGFDVSLQVFSRTDDGVRAAPTVTISSPDVSGAIVARGNLLTGAGVPDYSAMAAPLDRAKAAPDRLPGPIAEKRPEMRAVEVPTARSEDLAGDTPEPEPSNDLRALDTGPDGNGPIGLDNAERAKDVGDIPFDTPFSEAADAWDVQVDQADRASDILREQLDQYVDQGGSWVLGALGATALDVAGHAMTFTRGLADTARLGQGIAQGTWAGGREDAGRLLNVLPQGKIATVLDVGLGAVSMVEAAAQGDATTSAIAAAGIVLAGVGKKPSGKKNAPNVKSPPSTKSTFAAIEDMPRMTGFHRHHIALGGIFRRARSKRLRELMDKVGGEFLSEGKISEGGSHHTLHKIVNARLKAAGLFPGDKNTFTNAEVERALGVLIDTYRDEKIADFADEVEALLARLKADGLL